MYGQKKRRNAARIYDRLLGSIDLISCPSENDLNKHVYHLYVIKAKNRDELKKYLSSHGIQTVVNYSKALPFYKAYDYLTHTHQDFPNAYSNQSQILSLPIHPFIKETEQEYVSQKIEDFYH